MRHNHDYELLRRFVDSFGIEPYANLCWQIELMFAVDCYLDEIWWK
jgi:hypothetical protein